MEDKLTLEQRHRCMTSIWSKDTKPYLCDASVGNAGHSLGEI